MGIEKVIELNRIYNEDCLETMARMGDGEIDCIVTDVPYGIGESARKNNSRGSRLAVPTNFPEYGWDKKQIDKNCFDEMLRVSRHQIIFGGQCYANWLPQNYGWIFWDKDNGKTDFSDDELAYTSFLTGVRMFKWRWNGMIQERMGAQKEKRYHPTQKPVPVMRWIINKFTQPDWVIYDPMGGSGTTAIACILERRQWIMSEKRADYCEIAEKRIRPHLQQITIFDTGA